MNDCSRSLELLCPTCAGSAFEFDETVDPTIRVYHCIGCAGSFDPESLMQANSSRIEAEKAAIGQDAVTDALKKLRKSLSGNKFIKIK